MAGRPGLGPDPLLSPAFRPAFPGPRVGPGVHSSCPQSARPWPSSSSRLDCDGAGPHFPLRSALAASCAAYRVLFRPRGLVPRRSASLAAATGHSLIHCADQQLQGAGCVLGVGGDEGEFRGQSDTALALGTHCPGTSQREGNGF